MEKIVSFDKHGRLYIPENLRRILQFKTFIAKTQRNGIFLEFIEKDPIKALANLGKEKLKKKTIKQLKEEARKSIEENALKKIRRH